MIKSFFIKNVKDIEVPKLILAAESAGIYVFPMMKEEARMGYFQSVLYDAEETGPCLQRTNEEFSLSRKDMGFKELENFDEFIELVFGK
jgi:hypothetical protein